MTVGGGFTLFYKSSRLTIQVKSLFKRATLKNSVYHSLYYNVTPVFMHKKSKLSNLLAVLPHNKQQNFVFYYNKLSLFGLAWYWSILSCIKISCKQCSWRETEWVNRQTQAGKYKGSAGKSAVKKLHVLSFQDVTIAGLSSI